MCVCVCVCVRARVCVCVTDHLRVVMVCVMSGDVRTQGAAQKTAHPMRGAACMADLYARRQCVPSVCAGVLFVL